MMRAEDFLIETAPVHADAHGFVVFGRNFDHLRKFVVAGGAGADITRIDAVFGQGLRAVGYCVSSLMTVVVKIAHQRGVHAHLVEFSRYMARPARLRAN